MTSNWSKVTGSFLGASLMAIVAVGCSKTVAESPPRAAQVQIARFSATPIDEATADLILADASRAARSKDGNDDAPCAFTISRDGTINEFPPGVPGYINTQADFEAVIALPGRIKVVEQINWCGQTGGAILGCAPVPGDSLAVVRFDTEGLLWLHEYGHNMGLNHREVPRSVMYPYLKADNEFLNDAECAALKVGTN
ncbi:MAG: matrixin family metalloprotease [Deltaproteobacteria bacterium]|nr:matrixin family metalloprotease [Deltaproteobacteria bacterium]